MITPKTMIYQEISSSEGQKTTSLVTPRPSSPREFFARIYGHLESEKPKGQQRIVQKCRQEEEFAECKSVSNTTDSSSDFDVHEVTNRETYDKTLREKAPASAALVQLAAGSLPLPPAPPLMHRIPGFPGNFPGFTAGLASLPGFLPPRPPLIFSGDVPFHSGFSAFLSRRRRGSGRARRQRTTFSAAQTLRLEVEFRRAEYVGRPRRLELAAALRLSETQVKIWFQNRRAKDKRIEKAHLDHHYRTLAGFPPEYYAGFAATTATSVSVTAPCGMCLYKREPCVHFNVKSRDLSISDPQCSSEKIPPQTDVLIN